MKKPLNAGALSEEEKSMWRQGGDLLPNDGEENVRALQDRDADGKEKC